MHGVGIWATAHIARKPHRLHLSLWVSTSVFHGERSLEAGPEARLERMCVNGERM